MEDNDLYVVITSYGTSSKFRDEEEYHPEFYNSLLVPNIDIVKISDEKE